MDYLIIALRIISVMALFLFLVLKTGRRKIAELPVYDFLSIIVLGSVIGADIAEPNIPHLPVLFAVVLIIALQYLVSSLLINNKKIARKITFGPTVIIQNGQFIKANMKRLKYSIETVLMLLREKDIFDLNEVEYAIVEGSGSISVLKKPQYLPLTPSDMKLKPGAKGLPLPLIIDGKVQDGNLQQLKRDRSWLAAELAQAGIPDFNEVFYADCTREGRLYISKIVQAQNFHDDFTL
ncbi:DUF421 domain-containing protein [Desulfitobacterium hafniense]|uniref:DUF421 domain-containing protein n=4 Tax=Desulfitobacterium hafniense TaxID=49338 RepID=Q24RS2_DESHY|nr:DUF421 domain-containing protein [Desulfitobacterium hafniense]ACL19978.1 protein of unknown function DUF421 [Desulfitobacterium hafniense DCB-2]KTE92509.1 hypothetical protein AT727_19365 [Desulfitobacterium hafniense]BAE85270.1 hypothetical protein DSY3481 [Desulfitobacterium hafniense Y51]